MLRQKLIINTWLLYLFGFLSLHILLNDSFLGACFVEDKICYAASEERVVSTLPMTESSLSEYWLKMVEEFDFQVTVHRDKFLL